MNDLSAIHIGHPVPPVNVAASKEQLDIGRRLISETYRGLNAELHARNPHYGTSGQKWAGQVADLVGMMKATSILDYGCGKQTLAAALPHLMIRGYDPAIPALSGPPEPADFVVCTEVLEHLEPDYLHDVLDDLKRCTGLAIFMTVATRPAKKFLADGRNAHLIQQPCRWWLPKIMDRWDLRILQTIGTEFAVFAVRMEAQP